MRGPRALWSRILIATFVVPLLVADRSVLAQIEQPPGRIDAPRRLANISSTIRVTTTELGQAEEVHVLLDAEGMIESGAGFVARIDSSNALVARDGQHGVAWRLLGELRTPGALAFTIGDRRATVLNPTAF